MGCSGCSSWFSCLGNWIRKLTWFSLIIFFPITDDTCGCKWCCILNPCSCNDSSYTVPNLYLWSEHWSFSFMFQCLLCFLSVSRTRVLFFFWWVLVNYSQRGPQQVSRLAIGIVVVVWAFAAVCFFIALPTQSWLWLISIFK